MALEVKGSSATNAERLEPVDLRRRHMFNYLSAPPMMASLALVGLTLGCEGRSPLGPTEPAGLPAPIVTAIVPSAGSTAGDTLVTITGTGFHPQATVTIGGVNMSVSVEDSTTIHLTTQAHEAAQVDVVVVNPDGQADRADGGFVYAPPQAFDFNGDWVGAFGSDQETTFRFTIQNNVLSSVSCGTIDFIWSRPPSVRNGEFSVFRDDGVGISGRIVSATAARGTMNIPPCTATTWVATKQ